MSEVDTFEYVFRSPQSLYFSIFNTEVEGYYVEVEDILKVNEVIEKTLHKYNDTSER